MSHVDEFESSEPSEDPWRSTRNTRVITANPIEVSTSSSDEDEEDIITMESVRTIRRMQSAHSVRDVRGDRDLDNKVHEMHKTASLKKKKSMDFTREAEDVISYSDDVSPTKSSSSAYPSAKDFDAKSFDKSQAAPKDAPGADKSADKPAQLVSAPSSGRMQLSKRERGFIIGGLALALLMAALDNTIVGTALPKIVEDLTGSPDEYSWVVISYLLASTALAPTYGRFADLWGRRNVYFACMTVFLVGSALCGAALNMTWLIVARAVQGLGGGGLVGLAFVVIGDIAAPRDRGKYAGVLGGMFALASVFGPLAGGLLTDHASWRWCFYINLPIGVAAFIMLAIAFRRNKGGNNTLHLDFTGTLVMITVVILVELGISWGGSRYEWDDPIIILLLVVGLFLIIPFIFSQRDAPAPIVPLRLFKYRNFTIASLAGFLLGIPMFASFIFLPVWFQSVRFYSATNSGVQLLALMFSLIVASIVAGGLMSKTGHYRPMLWIGSALLPIGYGCVYLMDVDSGQETFIPIQLAIGFGIGLCLNVMTTMAQNVVLPEDLAVATTTVTFFRTVGASLGIAVFTAVLAEMSAQAAEELGPEIAELGRLFGPAAQPIIESRVAAIAIPKTFLYTTPIAVLPFVVFLFTEHIPLKTEGDESAAPAH